MTPADEQARTIRGQHYNKLPWPGRSRLDDDALRLAYIAWIPLVMLVVGLVLASISTYSAYLHIPRVSSGLPPADPNGQLTEGGMQELQAWRLSLNAYIAYLVIGNLFLVVSFLGMGTVIVWRTWGKTKNWMALCAAYLLVTFPLNVITPMLFTLPASWAVLINILCFLGEMCLSLFGCLFPLGRFMPRWTGWLALGSAITWGIYIFVPAASSPSSILAAMVLVLILLSTGCLLEVQVYRYRRVSNQVQRQQTKWVFFGLGSMGSGFIIWAGLSTLLYYQGMFKHVLVQSLFNVSRTLLLLLIPLSIGFAILRYRLWDIDFIINRTLVYGSLTVMLALLYFGLVIGLESLVRLLTEQVSQSPVIIVASTLAVAALFQPLRHRIQAIIDRRFYRRKYDTAKTLAAFSATVRNEVDLTQLSEHLLNVVQETMQPAHVSLWLRSPAPHGSHPARWRASPADPSKDEAREER